MFDDSGYMQSTSHCVYAIIIICLMTPVFLGGSVLVISLVVFFLCCPVMSYYVIILSIGSAFSCDLILFSTV
jgi:hypothetical protein